MTTEKKTPPEEGASAERAGPGGDLPPGFAAATFACLGLATLPIAAGGDRVRGALDTPGTTLDLLTPSASQALEACGWLAPTGLLLVAAWAGTHRRGAAVVSSLGLAFLAWVVSIFTQGFGSRVRWWPTGPSAPLVVIEKRWQSQARLAVVEAAGGSWHRRRYRVVRGTIVGLDEGTRAALERLLGPPAASP